jgi:hypothetical protein
MQKAIPGTLVLALTMCVPALAQYAAQQNPTDQGSMSSGSMKADKSSAKVRHIKGTVGDDGTTFTSEKDKKSFTIQNPEAVKGHEGHHVIVSAHTDPDKNQIEIMSLKMAPTSASNMKHDNEDKMKN